MAKDRRAALMDCTSPAFMGIATIAASPNLAGHARRHLGQPRAHAILIGAPLESLYT
jgi:hypothetical protein